jgi:outer membrane lipoprotein-sorting protein
MMARRLRLMGLFGVALLVTCAAASAVGVTDLADGVRNRLVNANVLRGQFEQTKHVAGFKKALVSKGDFLVAKERGVLWQTREPFPSTLRLTRNEIRATQNGAVAFRLDASSEPSVSVINGVLFSLLNGDVAALEQHFQIDGALHGSAWHLTLTPKDANMAKLMQRIELDGDQFVRHIEIAEGNGDDTSINLSGQSSEPAALSSDESARFD